METVAVVYDLQEALLLKSVLEGHGIAAFIPDENMAQLNWFYVNALGGIRVQVSPAVAVQARALLNDSREDATTGASCVPSHGITTARASQRWKLLLLGLFS